MVQIVPRSNFLGESLEKNFGQMGANMSEGISSGLTALANMKLQQMQQRHQQNRFQPLLEKAGYSPEIATLISSYDQPQQTALMNMLGLPGGMFSQQQQQQTNPNLQAVASLLGTPSTEQAVKSALQQQLQSRLQNQFGAQQPQQAYQNQLMASAMGQQMNPYADILRTLNPTQIQQLSTQMAQAGMNPQSMQQQVAQPMAQMAPQMQGQPIDQVPQAETPESLRDMANYIEQRGGSRYKNKVADLRKRARDLENAQRRQAERTSKPKKLTDDDRQRFYLEASKTEKNTAKAIELAKKLALEAGYRE